jgi:hypothetical protein
MYAPPGRVLLARLDEESKQWHAYDSGRWWPGPVIEQCDEDQQPA